MYIPITHTIPITYTHTIPIHTYTYSYETGKGKEKVIHIGPKRASPRKKKRRTLLDDERMNQVTTPTNPVQNLRTNPHKSIEKQPKPPKTT